MLPNFFIIGAMKAGTTTLYNYLRTHPDIYMCPEKEPHFFSVDSNWAKGSGWYASLYSGRRKQKAIGDASVTYMRYPQFPNVPARIYQTLPDARLICILRNPVARIYSHYSHLYREGLEERSLENALTAKRGELPGRLEIPPLVDLASNDPLAKVNEYIAFSLYWRQIQHYLQYFPPEQLLVILFEEMVENPITTLKSVYNFLEIDDSIQPKEVDQAFNKSADKLADRKWFGKIKQLSAIKQLYFKLPLEARMTIGTQTKKALKNILWYEREMHGKVDKEYVAQQFGNVLREDAVQLSEFLGRDMVTYWKL
jgi:hypothetical protein